MTDISYDLDFNDVRVMNGDFQLVDRCGQQNAAIIIYKSCVDIFRPQYGIGLSEVYPHMNTSAARSLLDDAKQQIYEDGAASVYLTFNPVDHGEYEIVTRVRYKGE